MAYYPAFLQAEREYCYHVKFSLAEKLKVLFGVPFAKQADGFWRLKPRDPLLTAERVE